MGEGKGREGEDWGHCAVLKIPSKMPSPGLSLTLTQTDGVADK